MPKSLSTSIQDLLKKTVDGNKLKKEIHKFAEWEDASDERVEEAMGNIGD